MLPRNTEFLQPIYLHFLLVIIPLLGVASILLAIRRIRRLQPSQNSIYPKLGEGIRWVLLGIGLTIIFLALAQPTNTFPTWVKSGPIDIIVVLDQSLSMRADDIDPSRFEQGKKAALTIVQSGALKNDDRISLFTFAKVERLVVPLTSDIGRFAADISDLAYPNTNQITKIDAYFWGSDLNGSIQQVLKVLEKQATFEENFQLTNEDEGRKRIIFFITDGSDEITTDNSDTSVQNYIREFRKNNAIVYPIAIGTKKGVPWLSLLNGYIRGKHYTDEDVKDWNGRTAQLNTALLETIARESGGELFIMETPTDNPRNFIIENINENRPELIIEKNINAQRPLWWETLLIATSLIILALIFL